MNIEVEGDCSIGWLISAMRPEGFPEGPCRRDHPVPAPHTLSTASIVHYRGFVDVKRISPLSTSCLLASSIQPEVWTFTAKNNPHSWFSRKKKSNSKREHAYTMGSPHGQPRWTPRVAFITQNWPSVIERSDSQLPAGILLVREQLSKRCDSFSATHPWCPDH